MKVRGSGPRCGGFRRKSGYRDKSTRGSRERVFREGEIHPTPSRPEHGGPMPAGLPCLGRHPRASTTKRSEDAMTLSCDSSEPGTISIAERVGGTIATIGSRNRQLPDAKESGVD